MNLSHPTIHTSVPSDVALAAILQAVAILPAGMRGVSSFTVCSTPMIMGGVQCGQVCPCSDNHHTI